MKKLFIIALFLGTINFTKAQDFSHSLGINHMILTDGFVDVGADGIHYVPRLNFELGDMTSFSLAAPVTLGFSLSSRNGSAFIFDLPVSAEFNMGRLATTDNDEGFGMFAGGGLGFTSLSIDGSSGSFLGWNGYLGARFAISEQPLELRLNYGAGFGDWSEVSKIGIALTYTLGFE